MTAAGGNGGGIVYLPAAKYKITGTLDVPGGVELRGASVVTGDIVTKRIVIAEGAFFKGSVNQEGDPAAS